MRLLPRRLWEKTTGGASRPRIDLAVPFYGSYVEHHDWNDWYKQRFQYTCNKRAAFAWQELNDVRHEYGMPSVPLTGFVPNVAEPRRQKYWSE